MKKANRNLKSRSPNDIDRLVGSNMRALRLERNLTLQELGDQLGISHQQLQKYETGMNRISAGMLPRLANLLGIEMTELFVDAKEAERSPMSKTERLREDCASLLRRTQSEETLQTVKRVLRALTT